MSHYLDDPTLSISAMGLLTWLMRQEDGYGVSARKIGEDPRISIGRRGATSALNELVEKGYVTRTRYQRNGEWWTLQEIVPEVRFGASAEALEERQFMTSNGELAPEERLGEVALEEHPLTVCSPVAKTTNSQTSLRDAPAAPGARVISMLTRQPLEPAVGYELFDEGPAVAKKHPAGRTPYAKKPVEKWHSRDLAYYFRDEMRERHVTESIGGCNIEGLSGQITKWLADGLGTRAQVKQMIDDFFAEYPPGTTRPRRHFDTGLWKVFVGDAKRLQSRAQDTVEYASVDPEQRAADNAAAAARAADLFGGL